MGHELNDSNIWTCSLGDSLQWPQLFKRLSLLARSISFCFQCCLFSVSPISEDDACKKCGEILFLVHCMKMDGQRRIQDGLGGLSLFV